MLRTDEPSTEQGILRGILRNDATAVCLETRAVEKHARCLLWHPIADGVRWIDQKA